jgi:TonB dependent receptor
VHHYNPDVAVPGVLNYQADKELGLVGGIVTNFGGQPAVGFPRMTGMGNSFGGVAVGFGPGNANHYYVEKPAGVVNLSYIRNNHSYKLGADWQSDSYTDNNVRGSQGIFNFSGAETALPYTLGVLGGGAVGHPYASFLLGAADSASVSSPQQPQFRKQSWSLFVQDTWKVTRKLTLDYSLRWDYQQPPKATHNRVAEFSPTTPNPSPGGLPGATIYEGSGPGRCGCNFVDGYPYAVGPRIGVAYQVLPKLVFRAGWGVTYSTTNSFNYITNTPIFGMGWNNLVFVSPSYGTPAAFLRDGLRYSAADLYANSTDPGIRPGPNQLNPPPYYMDPKGGRPTRLNQWNFSLQHELSKNLVLEGAYVANRGVWEQANGLLDFNALTAQRLASFGLDLNNAANRSLLTSRIDSAQVIAAGFKPPYPGYPGNATLAQSLRPFPQFTNISNFYVPRGNRSSRPCRIRAWAHNSFEPPTEARQHLRTVCPDSRCSFRTSIATVSIRGQLSC